MPGRLFPKSFEGQAPREFGTGANILKTRTFDLSVARDLEEIEIGGSCIWAMSASSLTASIDVRINDQLRDPLTFSQGMFIRGVPFSRVFVSHAAQAGAAITLFFAVEEDVKNIEIINPSLAFNNVTVADITMDNSWYYDTSIGRAYIGSGWITADIGGDNSHVQLWNPAASGYNLICNKIDLTAGPIAAAYRDVFIGHHNVALTIAELRGNKYLNEAVGVGAVFTDYVTGALGTSITSYRPSSDRITHIFKPPFLIPEGRGLHVGHGTFNEELHASFEWIEVPV